MSTHVLTISRQKKLRTNKSQKKKKVVVSKERRNWFVYLLHCGDGTFYTGITNDIQKRLEKHKAGTGAKYTRGRLPLKVLFVSVPFSRSKAMQVEYAVKKLNRNQKLSYLQQIKK